MEQRFTYRSKAVNLVLSLILGLGVSATGVWGSATGAILGRRGNALSPEFSFGVFIFMVVVGIGLLLYGLRLAFAGTREVVVAPTHLELPASPSSKRILQVPFAEISNVVAQNDPVNGLALTIVYGNGKSVKLAKFAFQNAAAFEECCTAVDRAWHAMHQ